MILAKLCPPHAPQPAVWPAAFMLDAIIAPQLRLSGARLGCLAGMVHAVRSAGDTGESAAHLAAGVVLAITASLPPRLKTYCRVPRARVAAT